MCCIATLNARENSCWNLTCCDALHRLTASLKQPRLRTGLQPLPHKLPLLSQTVQVQHHLWQQPFRGERTAAWWQTHQHAAQPCRQATPPAVAQWAQLSKLLVSRRGVPRKGLHRYNRRHRRPTLSAAANRDRHGASATLRKVWRTFSPSAPCMPSPEEHSPSPSLPPPFLHTHSTLGCLRVRVRVPSRPLPTAQRRTHFRWSWHIIGMWCGVPYESFHPLRQRGAMSSLQACITFHSPSTH